MAAGAWAEAHEIVQGMLRGDGANAELLSLLASVQYGQRSYEACETTLERLLALAPYQMSQNEYWLLAKLKSTAQKHADAVALMARAVAVFPGDIGFLAGYADFLDPQSGYDVLRDHLAKVADNPAKVAFLLRRMTMYRAPAERRRHHLPENFGISWEDTYRWPDAPGLAELKTALEREFAAGSRRVTAVLDRAYVALAEQDWNAAAGLLDDARRSGKKSLADFMAVGEAFHAELDGMDLAEIVGGFPPVRRVASHPPQASETFYIACDPAYFAQFALPFIRTVDAMGTALDIHVHLLDGDEAAWAGAARAVEECAAARVSVSAEASRVRDRGADYARIYYQSARFVRLFQELRNSSRPIWLVDADVHALRDPHELFATLGAADLAIRTNPCSFDPRFKLNAGCVGIAPTPRGLEFARRVAAYIAYWKDRGTWDGCVDQLALYSAYAHMHHHGRAPETVFLGARDVSFNAEMSGVLNFTTGIAKFTAPGAVA